VGKRDYRKEDGIHVHTIRDQIIEVDKSGRVVDVWDLTKILDPSLAEVAAAAAPLIAASVITTAILTPVLTSWVAKKQARQASLEKNA
ncbi:aryl-sulfate sulfotransferase, partial [Salmonella enterica]|uniref:aryl-sulfate sulfotransferase n=1 Tax=Salmonella enterica TaxID=28901 RepID=UPI001D0CC1AC